MEKMNAKPFIKKDPPPPLQTLLSLHLFSCLVISKLVANTLTFVFSLYAILLL